jgi:hypothetical protein
MSPDQPPEGHTDSVDRVAQLELKVRQISEEYKRELEAHRKSRAELAMVSTSFENVWRWQGDKGDHPESLSCPVVMSADTVRALVDGQADQRKLAAETSAFYMGAFMRGYDRGRHQALQEIMAASDAWPLLDVLMQCSQAIEHLMQQHDCDAQGWEHWRSAGKHAGEHATRVERLARESVKDESGFTFEVTEAPRTSPGWLATRSDGKVSWHVNEDEARKYVAMRTTKSSEESAP